MTTSSRDSSASSVGGPSCWILAVAPEGGQALTVLPGSYAHPAAVLSDEEVRNTFRGVSLELTCFTERTRVMGRIDDPVELMRRLLLQLDPSFAQQEIETSRRISAQIAERRAAEEAKEAARLAAMTLEQVAWEKMTPEERRNELRRRDGMPTRAEWAAWLDQGGRDELERYEQEAPTPELSGDAVWYWAFSDTGGGHGETPQAVLADVTRWHREQMEDPDSAVEVEFSLPRGSLVEYLQTGEGWGYTDGMNIQIVEVRGDPELLQYWGERMARMVW